MDEGKLVELKKLSAGDVRVRGDDVGQFLSTEQLDWRGWPVLDGGSRAQLSLGCVSLVCAEVEWIKMTRMS